jgi:MYXO-CTERM domain-containing protein
MIDRRQFVTGAGTCTLALAVARTTAAQGGASPYGRLLPPDASGLRLPEGFTSRVVARSGETVEGTRYVWPAFPDGAATFPAEDGGWYHAVNSENPVAGDGGVSVIRYDPEGRVADAYSVLAGTQSNCAGGPTPWGTWLSCEEHPAGRVWECDPATVESGVVRPALGTFEHEAAAVDPDGQRVYLTEDAPDGCLYRFTPDAYPDLQRGLLEVASVTAGQVTWYEMPDPAAEAVPTRHQVPQCTHFDGGEGIWFSDGTVWFTTKGNDQVWALDPASDRLEVAYDGSGILRGVDNITSEAGSGDLYVAEDGDDMQLVVLTADGTLFPILQVVAEPLPANAAPSEITGPAFSPDGTHLYFSSQRGGNPQTGITYEVTGPFRGLEQAEPPSTTTTIAAAAPPAPATDDTEDDDGSSPAVPIAIGVGAAAVVAAGAIAVRRRREA